MKCLPERGQIGIFNRSYDEETRLAGRLALPITGHKVISHGRANAAFGRNTLEAYEDMICNTATDCAPWYGAPADNKWFTRVVVAAAVIEALASLDLQYPEVSEAQFKELAAAKEALIAGDEL